jgi:hypothetical protein
MAPVDRQLVSWLVLLVIGIAGVVLAFLGEFVFHWFNDFGEWAVWVSLAIAVVAALGAATRFQVRTLGDALAHLTRSSERVEGNTLRIEANTQRIEANTHRIEANTQRIEANTAESVALLREIRDRLPLAGR